MFWREKRANYVILEFAGIKPLISAVIMACFLWRMPEQRRMLDCLDAVDAAFFAHFAVRPNVQRLNRVVIGLVLVTFACTLAVRITEFVALGDRLGRSFLIDTSLILVPLLSLWNLVPLFYYELVNRVARFWSKALAKQIHEGTLDQGRSLRFYYRLFIKITRLQAAIGDVFNPFVLMSLGWSVFSLCLTIYFVTQADETMYEPPRRPGISAAQWVNIKAKWIIVVYFNLIWSIIQICIAIAHILVICASGTHTNECVCAKSPHLLRGTESRNI